MARIETGGDEVAAPKSPVPSVIVEGISSKKVLYHEAESYMSHHQTSKHQCMRLGSVPNLNNQASKQPI